MARTKGLETQGLTKDRGKHGGEQGLASVFIPSIRYVLKWVATLLVSKVKLFLRTVQSIPVSQPPERLVSLSLVRFKGLGWNI